MPPLQSLPFPFLHRNMKFQKLSIAVLILVCVKCEDLAIENDEVGLVDKELEGNDRLLDEEDSYDIREDDLESLLLTRDQNVQLRQASCTSPLQNKAKPCRKCNADSTCSNGGTCCPKIVTKIRRKKKGKTCKQMNKNCVKLKPNLPAAQNSIKQCICGNVKQCCTNRGNVITTTTSGTTRATVTTTRSTTTPGATVAVTTLTTPRATITTTGAASTATGAAATTTATTSTTTGVTSTTTGTTLAATGTTSAATGTTSAATGTTLTTTEITTGTTTTTGANLSTTGTASTTTGNASTTTGNDSTTTGTASTTTGTTTVPAGI